MNIWLPIITNLVILGILVAGMFAGKKNGWKIELSKFIITAAALVGLYFLCPVITKALLGIEAIAQIAAASLWFIPALNSIVMLVSFLIIYMIVCLILAAIRKHSINKKLGQVKTKRIKVKGADRKADRDLKRQNRKLRKEQIKAIKQSKTSKAFGLIFGFLTAILVSFIVIMPFKYITKGIVEAQPELSQIESAYEYTPYGQLDKVAPIADFINHIEIGE